MKPRALRITNVLINVQAGQQCPIVPNGQFAGQSRRVLPPSVHDPVPHTTLYFLQCTLCSACAFLAQALLQKRALMQPPQT